MSYPPFNEGYITATYLNNYLVFRFEFILFAGSKAHATARGLQPPACCGHPAMWWMAKRLHRCVSARMVAKWVMLTKTVGEQNRESIKTGQGSINKLSAGDYLLVDGWREWLSVELDGQSGIWLPALM